MICGTYIDIKGNHWEVMLEWDIETRKFSKDRFFCFKYEDEQGNSGPILPIEDFPKDCKLIKDCTDIYE